MNQQQQSCLICYADGNHIRFDCQDCFCRSCIQQLYKEQIEKQQYNIICPQCNKQLSMKTLNQIFSLLNITYNQQILLSIENLINKNNIEKLVRCLNPNCSEAFILWKEADYFTCPQCANSYCLKCRQPKHENNSCIDNLRSNAVLKSRIQFLNQTKEINNQVCPHCLMVVEKTGGCNFITCKSKYCQQKKYFCFKCGIALTNNDSSEHFTGNSPFRGECKILVNNQWFEKNKIPNNDFSCPGCSTKSSFDCKIEGNVIYCKSNNCKDKLFCKICLIEMTNENLIYHLANHNKNDWKFKAKCFFQKLKFF